MTTAQPPTPSPAPRRWRAWLIGIAVSALAIFYIVLQLDMALLGEALANARYIYVLPSLALLALGLYTRALRWRGLLQNTLPPLRAFHILNVSYLVNGVLPLRLGEVARAWLASRAEPTLTIPRALSTVVVERLLDLLAVIGLIALAASAEIPELRAAAIAAAPLAFIGLIVLVLLAGNKVRALRLVDWFLAQLPFLRRLHLDKIAGDVLDGFAALTRPAAFASAVGWTIISWFLSVAAGYVLMYAFWDTASWEATMAFIAAASLAIAVPAVPGNIGTYELSIIGALTPFGYSPPLETATAFAVLVHAANLLLYALMGGIGLWREGVTIGQLRSMTGKKDS
jgi:hypothetical protein